YYEQKRQKKRRREHYRLSPEDHNEIQANGKGTNNLQYRRETTQRTREINHHRIELKTKEHK
ncbi:hypothetical protein, partial [Rhizobium brockwellii]|uniref:hypothetical protein n=1 Tax=Rhizobium brockwellii TaxID=3019932 RepID=UPI003F946F53